MVEISEDSQELLEALWIRENEGVEDPQDDRAKPPDPAAVRELQELGLVTADDSSPKLTDSGRLEARDVVRKHRLAERLLADVLSTEMGVLHSAACKFEHVLYGGVDRKICTLLGHPATCPHGRPIPPGPCCQGNQRETPRIVASLDELEPGQDGVIAYLQTSSGQNLQKLMSMGILPGMEIKLLRRSPAFVFEVAHTRYAVDREIAGDIRVRLAD